MNSATLGAARGITPWGRFFMPRRAFLEIVLLRRVAGLGEPRCGLALIAARQPQAPATYARKEVLLACSTGPFGERLTPAFDADVPAAKAWNSAQSRMSFSCLRQRSNRSLSWLNSSTEPHGVVSNATCWMTRSTSIAIYAQFNHHGRRSSQ